MKDFILAALPWICMGLALSIFAASYKVSKKRKTEKNEEDVDKPEENYGLMGMCLGLSVGAAIGAGTGHYGTSMTTGMLLGLAIGNCIKKDGTE